MELKDLNTSNCPKHNSLSTDSNQEQLFTKVFEGQTYFFMKAIFL